MPVFHLGHLAGDNWPLAGIAVPSDRRPVVRRVKSALLDVDIEDLCFDDVAFLVFLDHLLTGTFPVQIGQVDHAVDIAIEPEKQSELCFVLDFAFDGWSPAGVLDEHLHGLHGLLQTEEDRRLTGSTSRTCTSTSCEVGDDLADERSFVQDISDTWISPSMPGSSSTNAP